MIQELKGSKKKDSKDLFVQWCLVLFFDLLGQRETLRQIKVLPAKPAEKPEFIKAITETFGKVDLLRTGFKGILFGLPNPHHTETQISKTVGICYDDVE